MPQDLDALRAGSWINVIVGLAIAATVLLASRVSGAQMAVSLVARAAVAGLAAQRLGTRGGGAMTLKCHQPAPAPGVCTDGGDRAAVTVHKRARVTTKTQKDARGAHWHAYTLQGWQSPSPPISPEMELHGADE